MQRLCWIGFELYPHQLLTICNTFLLGSTKSGQGSQSQIKVQSISTLTSLVRTYLSKWAWFSIYLIRPSRSHTCPLYSDDWSEVILTIICIWWPQMTPGPGPDILKIPSVQGELEGGRINFTHWKDIKLKWNQFSYTRPANTGKASCGVDTSQPLYLVLIKASLSLLLILLGQWRQKHERCWPEQNLIQNKWSTSRVRSPTLLDDAVIFFASFLHWLSIVG